MYFIDTMYLEDTKTKDLYSVIVSKEERCINMSVDVFLCGSTYVHTASWTFQQWIILNIKLLTDWVMNF